VGALRVNKSVVAVFMVQIKLTSSSKPQPMARADLGKVLNSLYWHWGHTPKRTLASLLMEELGVTEDELLPVFMTVTSKKVTSNLAGAMAYLEQRKKEGERAGDHEVVAPPNRVVHVVADVDTMASLWSDPVRLLGHELSLGTLGGRLDADELASLLGRMPKSDAVKALVQGRLTKREKERARRDEEQAKEEAEEEARKAKADELVAFLERTILNQHAHALAEAGLTVESMRHASDAEWAIGRSAWLSVAGISKEWEKALDFVRDKLRSEGAASQTPKRPRGRPRKAPAPAPSAIDQPQKRPRGRPRKIVATATGRSEEAE